ncbi:MAG TPA: ATP-binding cassette domain-containing protein [Acidimicrobiia bacterium]|nr:ATP-binding cassette domain-containing protein [Acidimicrobiia bacterium]
MSPVPSVTDAVEVRLESVTVEFGRGRKDPLRALDGLDLDLRPGEVTVLLGPNGSGKTTTVNLVCGLLRPTSGRVWVGGIEAGEDPDGVRALLGVTPQETALYEDLTAYENLIFHAQLYRVPPLERRQRIAEVLELVGLSGRQDDRVGAYSGGMQRRLALARALLTHPPVLILDEPTLGVDVQSRAAIWERIRETARRGCTVLLTTNYMEEAAALADRLAVLDGGRIVAEGSVHELQRQLASDVIELDADLDTAGVEALSVLAGVLRVEGNPPRFRLWVADGQSTLLSVAELMRDRGVNARVLSLREPDLNDVFLELTGRELRD